MPPWQTNFTADDYVEYTWHAPTARIFPTVPVLKAPDKAFTYPAWAANALSGVPAAIDPGIWVGGKTIAATMIDLLTQPASWRAPRGIPRAHRRRRRRRQVGGAAAAQGLSSAHRSALAGIRAHRARRGMVSAHASRRLRRRPAAVVMCAAR